MREDQFKFFMDRQIHEIEKFRKSKQNESPDLNSNDCVFEWISKNAKKLKHNVSRIIMNLPEKNLEFIKILPPFISDTGTLLRMRS